KCPPASDSSPTVRKRQTAVRKRHGDNRVDANVEHRYRSKMSSTRSLLFVTAAWCLISFSPAQAQVLCAGDCGANGPVTVDDLVGMVDVALGTAPLSSCAAGDIDHDGEIHVDEILAAVRVALIGCPALAIDTASESRCDPTNEPCMLPLPNDYFTVADAATDTGRRLALVAESLPINVMGNHVDPTDQN